MTSSGHLFKILKSSVGKKIIMAVTGMILIGFVGMHLLGNFQIFSGQEQLNSYAEHLQNLPLLLYPARIFLIIVVFLHIATATLLSWENYCARPVPYAYKNTVQATWASRTMLISGIFIFSFIVYHLLNFTFGTIPSQFSHLIDAQGRHDVYSMVILSFRNRFLSGTYILSMGLLSLHLSHGISSLFQSLGLSDEQIMPVLKKTSIAVALLIFLGSISIPLASLLGVLK